MIVDTKPLFFRFIFINEARYNYEFYMMASIDAVFMCICEAVIVNERRSFGRKLLF